MPPPVGGWDALSALADMPIENAPRLDNWFPQTDRVTLRRGSALFASGLGGSVDTLIPYVGVDGAQQLFGAVSGDIYDATAGGTVGAPVVSGMTNARWQFVQANTAGGNFLFLCNGEDTPQQFDGTSWTDSTVAAVGLTATNLIWCNVHNRRLWFGEKDSLVAWYLPVNSITGTPTLFDLSGFASLGGYIMAMGTWALDSGGGPRETAVFITSQGEAIVYSGTDPDSDWTLQGTFRIGRPMGRRCVVKAASDLIVITEDGFLPFSTALSLDRSQRDRAALSYQINRALNEAVQRYSGNFGWQPLIYPRGTMIIFNIPTGAASAQQFVFNTITAKPCRFTGLNARAWGLFDDNPYFGTANGRIYRFDTGSTDDGRVIVADAIQAFSYYRTPATKAFKMADVLLESDGNPNAAVNLCLDFQMLDGQPWTPQTVQGGGIWGEAVFGEAVFGGTKVYRGWRGLTGLGKSAAVRVRINGNGATPSWLSTSVMYVPGGML